jgi:GNAT superfamily N-acetyltransferase
MTDRPTTERHAVRPAYALLYDGTSVMIRELGPADLEAVRSLHHGMSPEDLYMRFFGQGACFAGRTAERMCRPPGPGHTALGAWSAGELVGVADYELDRPGVAEIALAVADGMHHRGVGRLLLEHLVTLARSRGVRTLHADTLVQNLAALRVVAATGMPVRSRFQNGVIELTLSLVPDGRERPRNRPQHAD